MRPVEMAFHYQLRTIYGGRSSGPSRTGRFTIIYGLFSYLVTRVWVKNILITHFVLNHPLQDKEYQIRERKT